MAGRDALIWAAARSQSPASGPTARVYRFDRRFPAREIDVSPPG